MFPWLSVFSTLFVVLAAAVLCLFGVIGVAALVWTYGLAAVAVTGALMLADRDRGVRATGAAFVAVALLGAGLAYAVTPAHAAEAAGIAAPPGDVLGLWAAINPWIASAEGAAITTLVGWATTFAVAHWRLTIKAGREASLIETLKTGFFQATHQLELVIDDNWTPAQRQKVVEIMRAWAETRAAGELKKLGLPSFVVDGIARKVVGQMLATLGSGAGLDTVEQVFAGRGAPGGNPGETPLQTRLLAGA